MAHLSGRWIPPNERSKFMSAYQGFSVGSALFYPLFGYVIVWTSWEWVYHLCGVIGAIWYVAWLYFVYDSPAEHPRIDPGERIYIEESLGHSVKRSKKVKTPWKAILTSVPVWVNVVTQFGGIWSMQTLMVQTPTYFKEILGWSIQSTGWLSGCPNLARAIFAIYFSLYCDYLLRTSKMTRTNVRRFAVSISNTLNGISMLALAYSGCNSIAAIAFVTLSSMFYGGLSAGSLANIVDLSPNFSGVVYGFVGFIGVLPAFISPYIVGQLTLGNQTVQQWQYIFMITAILLISSGCIYAFYSDSNVQSWNDLGTEEDSFKLEETRDDTKKSDNRNVANGNKV